MKLFDRSVVANIALLVGVGVPPFGCGITEQGDIEDIRLAGVGDGGLSRGDLDLLFWSEREAVQTCLFSKPVEFDGFELCVVEGFPDAKEFNRVPVA